MRGTRWLLLAAILLILGGTAGTYYYQLRMARGTQIATPAAIPPNTSSTAQDWEWSRSDNGRTVVRIRAHALRQVADTGRIELEGVRLELFQRDKPLYNLVMSPKADFNQSEGKLFSNGEVEITLDVPVGQEPTPKLTWIKSSGVTFESKSGKASTDRPAAFRFANGSGTSTGADYDPTSKELHLWKDVKLDLAGSGTRKPMHVETVNLVYKEVGSVVWLTPTARMVRGESVVDSAGAAVINLKDGEVTSIDAQKAHGVNTYPKRKVDYYADSVHVDYNDRGTVSKMTGMGNARLNSVSAVADTALTADNLVMDFADQDGESVLTHTAGNGHAVVESKPIPDPAKKTKTAETRILRSNFVDVYMRAGGQEIEKVQTQAPGVLEFLPNVPEEHRRLINGDRMTILYAPKNIIQNFVTNQATTETFPSAAELAKAVKDKKPVPSVSKTASVNMNADFDAKGQLKTVKQWDNFTYEEGDRRARAVTAILENDKNTMDLDQGARIWEPTGSTDSDHIRIDQKTGNFAADGHVNTSRLPDPKDAKKKNAAPGLLDEDQPTQGTADHMTSANKNKLLHYEGNAVVWQEANRITADRIDIDREKQILKASGKVVTQLLDKPPVADLKDVPKDAPKDAAKAKEPAVGVFTIVKAPDLVYTDADRLAHYTGGSTLNRPGLIVKGREIRAYLREQTVKDSTKPAPAISAADEEDDGSRLDKAFADGDVEIVEISPLRKRVGTGVHAEYYTADEKIILRGSEAVLVDSIKGTSQGAELTYFTGDDKLVVSSTPQKQVKTKLRKSTKKK
jgi:lipopolysaccharide export system protein LptA